MSDYISREAAIVDFERCNHENPVWTPQRVKTLLMRIPAAAIERWAQKQPSRIRFFAVRRWLKDMPRKENFYNENGRT